MARFRIAGRVRLHACSFASGTALCRQLWDSRPTFCSLDLSPGVNRSSLQWSQLICQGFRVQREARARGHDGLTHTRAHCDFSTHQYTGQRVKEDANAGHPSDKPFHIQNTSGAGDLTALALSKWKPEKNGAPCWDPTSLVSTPRTPKIGRGCVLIVQFCTHSLLVRALPKSIADRPGQ